MSEAFKVTLKRSLAGTSKKQRGTISALGLGKINSSNVVPNRPEIKGMITMVQHLIAIEEVAGK